MLGPPPEFDPRPSTYYPLAYIQYPSPYSSQPENVLPQYVYEALVSEGDTAIRGLVDAAFGSVQSMYYSHGGPYADIQSHILAQGLPSSPQALINVLSGFDVPVKAVAHKYPQSSVLRHLITGIEKGYNEREEQLNILAASYDTDHDEEGLRIFEAIRKTRALLHFPPPKLRSPKASPSSFLSWTPWKLRSLAESLISGIGTRRKKRRLGPLDI